MKSVTRRSLAIFTSIQLLSLAVAGSAFAALGDQLSTFIPSPSGNGRGIEVIPGTATSAYYTTTSSLDSLYRVNLKTQASETALNTNLDTIDASRSYGELAYDTANSRLIGARYHGTQSPIDAINVSTGAVTPLFSASNSDAAITGVDGLALNLDGSLFLSADGLGQTTTRIYNFTMSGTVIGSFLVSFGNSGIAFDGTNLWLVDVNNQIVREYTVSGTATGRSFATTGLTEPEGATIDECSFTGKKALWIYGAAFASAPMAAYEIGSSTNSNCGSSTTNPTTPTTPTTPGGGGGGGSPTISDPGAPGSIDVTKPGKGYRVRVPIKFKAPSTADPDGTLYTYLWDFGDYSINLKKPKKKSKKIDPVADKAETQHEYKCAGFYRPKLKVLDKFGNAKEIELNKKLRIDFPTTATKKHGGLQVSPDVTIGPSFAKLKLATKKLSKKKKTKVKRVTYFVDGRKAGVRKKANSSVKRKLKKGAHALKIKIKFKRPRGTKTITTCFQI